MDIADGNAKLDLVSDSNGAMPSGLSVDAILLGAANLSLTGHNGHNTLRGNDGDEVVKRVWWAR